MLIFSALTIYILKRYTYLNFTNGRVNEGKERVVMLVPSYVKKGDKRHWPYLREEDTEINIFKFQ